MAAVVGAHRLAVLGGRARAGKISMVLQHFFEVSAPLGGKPRILTV